MQSLPLAFLHQLNGDAYGAFAPLSDADPDR